MHRAAHHSRSKFLSLRQSGERLAGLWLGKGAVTQASGHGNGFWV